jgi:hypothetical protein
MTVCRLDEKPFYVNKLLQADTAVEACALMRAHVGGNSNTVSGSTCTIGRVFGTNSNVGYPIVQHCTVYDPDTDGINWSDQVMLLQVLLVASCVVMLVLGYRMGDKT